VPAEFRLPEPEFTKEQLDLLEELIQLITPTLSKAESVTRDGRLQMANFLVDLGTGIWRIRRKIEGMSRMPKEIRDALYSLESMWMSMSEGGVEIADHIGTIPSMREAKVVEVREIPNLPRQQVIDAIKPTILLKGEVVQLGEVIMGKPAQPSGTQAAVFPVSSGVSEKTAPETPEADGAETRSAEYPPEYRTEDAPPEEYDDVQSSHEVETLTMEPPRVWTPDESQVTHEGGVIPAENPDENRPLKETADGGLHTQETGEDTPESGPEIPREDAAFFSEETEEPAEPETAPASAADAGETPGETGQAETAASAKTPEKAKPAARKTRRKPAGTGTTETGTKRTARRKKEEAVPKEPAEEQDADPEAAGRAEKPAPKPKAKPRSTRRRGLGRSPLEDGAVTVPADEEEV
jgi:hypothetical protein